MAVILSSLVYDVEPETGKAAENGPACRQTLKHVNRFFATPLLPVSVVVAVKVVMLMVPG
jgi:hypothetical protein